MTTYLSRLMLGPTGVLDTTGAAAPLMLAGARWRVSPRGAGR